MLPSSALSVLSADRVLVCTSKDFSEIKGTPLDEKRPLSGEPALCSPWFGPPSNGLQRGLSFHWSGVYLLLLFLRLILTYYDHARLFESGSPTVFCVWYFLVVAVLRTLATTTEIFTNIFLLFFSYFRLVLCFSLSVVFVVSFPSSSSLYSSSSFSLFGFLFLFICLVFRNYSLPAHCLRLIARLILHIT